MDVTVPMKVARVHPNTSLSFLRCFAVFHNLASLSEGTLTVIVLESKLNPKRRVL